MYSIKENNPELPDIIMVHFSTFSKDPNLSPSFVSSDWKIVFEKIINRTNPNEKMNYYFTQHPNHQLTKTYTEKDEPELKYFLEKIFGVSYEKFLYNMKTYNGLFSGIRDENGKLIAMVHALRDEFNGVVHYELDHAVSTSRGSGSSVAAIGLIAQILLENEKPVISAECKVDSEEPIFLGALMIGLSIPPLPNSDLILYSENHPI